MLYLIGTQHNDPLLEGRLYAALEKIAPDVVLVEGDDAKVEEFKKRSDVVFKEFRDILEGKRYAPSEIDQVFTRLGLNRRAEHGTVFSYARRAGVSAVYLEHGHDPVRAVEEAVAFERERLNLCPDRENAGEWPELFMSEERFQQFIDEMYADFINEYDGSDGEKRIYTLEAHASVVGKRDEIMAEMVRRYNGRIAVVAGAIHFYQDEKRRTLYERVRDLNPLRGTVREFL